MPLYPTTRFSSIMHSIDYFIFDKVLKACFLTRKDIAKEGVKLILPFIIPSNVPYARQCSGYGFEAAWACYFKGPKQIPIELVKYTCVNACYDQLCNGAQFLNLDYPQAVQNNAKMYAFSRVMLPMVTKHGLGILIKSIFNMVCNSEDQEDDDAMLESQDYFVS